MNCDILITGNAISGCVPSMMNRSDCQVWVYSNDFRVSPDERKEQEFGQRLAQAGVTDWIQ